MRKLNFTGKKTLNKSWFSIFLALENGTTNLELSILSKSALLNFPRDSRILVSLSENKSYERLDMGNLVSPISSVVVPNGEYFSSPVSYIKIVSVANHQILGESGPITLKKDLEPDTSGMKSLLPLTISEISPLVWKLDLDRDDGPVLYLDRSIPNAKAFASSPVFKGLVMNSVIQQIFQKILLQGEADQTEWMHQWMNWLNLLLPNSQIPWNDEELQLDWLQTLQENFASRWNILQNFIQDVTQERV